MDQRKANTRHKIQLGGIVMKAGLGGLDAYVLLGLLLDQASTLDDPAEHARLRQIARTFASGPAVAKLDVLAMQTSPAA